MDKKMISRRDFLATCAALGATALLAACGPKATEAPAEEPAEEAPEEAPSTGEQTTVRYLSTHGAVMAPWIEKSLENFATEHPDIKVEHEDLTEGYYDRLNVMLASATLPDVVNLRSFDMYDWWRMGNVHSVSPFLDADPDLDAEDMVDAIMASCLYEGEYWGMPYDASVEHCYYNKAMFDAAGVEVPSDTWTYDDMLAKAQALTDPATETYGFARFPPYGDWQAEPWYLSNGVNIINEDRTEWTMVGEKAEEMLQWLIDLDKVHGVTPPAGAPSDINFFVVGKGAMYISGQWEIPGNRDAITDFEWDVAAFPTGPAGHKPITHGGTYVMYAKTKVADAAWQLQRWITAERDFQMNVYGASGYSIPALKEVAAEAWLAPLKNESKPPANAQVVLDELDAAVPGTLWPNYQKIATMMTEELQKALLGQATVAEALDTLKVRADEAIAEAMEQA
ncbi:MAG: sugar ABC transporter substrate-binding protein [Anaerolineales bacterium]|nr:sugar ABC transporter substrate-binding protein [Anaerolineales bacterium]